MRMQMGQVTLFRFFRDRFIYRSLAENSSVPVFRCPGFSRFFVAADIVALLAHYLPCRNLAEEEIFLLLELHHRKRQESITSAYAVQRAQGLM
jgi:hypothetical protein